MSNQNSMFFPANQPTTQVINISPALADSLLQRNKLNRNLKKAQVATYAEQMRQGRFQSLNGQTISVAGNVVNGTLLDGQHRLTALIEAGVTLPFLVVSGLSEDVIPTIDIGAKRTAGDLFDMNKIQYGRILSAAISTYAKLVYRAENDKRKIEGELSAYRLTPESIFHLYIKNSKDADEIVKLAFSFYEKFNIIGPSQIGGMMLYTRLHSVFKHRADAEFWKPLFTGENASGMVNVCRNYLINELGKPKYNRRSATELVNAIIKAYNTHFGMPTKTLKSTSLTIATKSDKAFL